MLAALAIAFAQAAVDPAAEVAGRVLHGYAGCWAVQGRELGTDGDSFSQDGIVLVSVDRNTGGIRLDEVYRVREATGRYLALAPERRFSELLYHDPSTRLFAVRSAGSPPPAANKVSLAAQGGEVTAYWQSLFRSQAASRDLMISHRRRFVDGERVEMRSHIRDPHGEFEEFYVAVWRRLALTDPRCADDAGQGIGQSPNAIPDQPEGKAAGS